MHMIATLRALSEADIEPVMAVGRRIWVSHYVPILGQAQVDYMVGMRFTADYLRRYLDAPDRWLDVLWLGGEPVGYCAYALTASPDELKLEQLYLLPELHGRGLGGQLLRHVTERAASLGSRTMMLQVNKQNTGSLGLYKKMGFAVREEAVFDIGHGFVMDDFIMEKWLASP